MGGFMIAEVARLLKENKKTITGVSLVAELEDLNGRKKIPIPVESQIKF